MNAVTGEMESLSMQGTWLSRQAAITDQKTGIEVAHIDREFLNARQVLGGRQTYDVSLITAICVGLDERRDEC